MIAAPAFRRFLSLLLLPPLAGCVAEAPIAVEVLTTIVAPAPGTVADELPGRVYAARRAMPSVRHAELTSATALYRALGGAS